MTKEEKLARKQQRKAEKVGLGKLLLWNSSSCSVALSTLMLGYATFYCTDVLQLAPALVGTLFMVSKIFDSFTDVVAGFIVDRTQTRWGKGRPYEIFMLFLWLSTWLLFSCPTSFATAAKCIWIFCMYTFMNSICVTFLNANNVVYMVRAFENKEQQSKIVGYGSIFTMAGAMVFNVLFPTAMAKVGTDAVGWSRLVGMIAIPLTAIGMLRILTIPEKFTPVSEKNGEQTHLKDLLPLLKESRPVLIICLVRFVQNIATGLGVGTYYWQYIIGNLGMMGIASVTTILVLPLAFALPGLRKKFGMAGMSVIGILVGCIGYLATFFAGGNMVFFIVAVTRILVTRQKRAFTARFRRYSRFRTKRTCTLPVPTAGCRMHRITTTRIMVRFTTDSLIRTWRKRLRIGRCLPICRKRIRAMPTTFGFPSFLTAIM